MRDFISRGWGRGGWGVQVKGDRILWEMCLLLLETLSHNSWREQQWNYHDMFDIFLLHIINHFNSFYLCGLITKKNADSTTFPRCIFHALTRSDVTGSVWSLFVLKNTRKLEHRILEPTTVLSAGTEAGNEATESRTAAKETSSDAAVAALLSEMG